MMISFCSPELETSVLEAKCKLRAVVWAQLQCLNQLDELGEQKLVTCGARWEYLQ